MMDPNNSTTSSTSSSLRSFRWRMQLGLLPPPTADVNPSDSSSQWNPVLAQQREDYQRLVEQHPFPDEQEQHSKTNDGVQTPITAITESPFDPLTAMLMEEQEKSERLQELDLKYRREKALRKRGYGNGNGGRIMEDEEYDEQAAALQIIDKDLDRLPSPHTKRRSQSHAPESVSLSSPSSSSPLSTSNQHNNNNSMNMDDTMVDVVLDDDNDDNANEEYSKLKRRVVLRQVLFVYTCEHPDPGYRQGMHEIASYLLHALQLDQDALLEQVNKFNEQYATTLTTTMEDLSADTYTLLVHILTAILPAYDVGPSAQSPSPLPAMSRRILNIIQEHCGELHYTLTELDTPPQLYLTKWIRLLYSREVTQVLELWDELFFPSVAVAHTTGKHSWMEVLECTAAARLLLWRQPILKSPDASHRLHLLMNLPVQADIVPLVQLTKQLLEYPHVRSVVVLPTEMKHNTVGLAGASASADAPVRPTITTASSTGLHPLQEHSITPTDQGHQQFASSHQDGDLGAAASALANRFSLSAVKQSLEQAKTQTESIKKQLYQGWGSLAVANTNSDHQQYQSNNTGSTQQGQNSYNNNSNFNPGSSARNPNVTGDPSRRNYDDPLMGGIDWSGGQRSRNLSSSSGVAASVTAAVLHPQLSGERQTPYASNESPSRVPPPHHVQQGQHPSQAWAQSIQASSMVLQDFVMAMEKQSVEHGGNSNAKVVPAAVWEALADLEVIRRDMLSSSGSSSGPAPPTTSS